MVRALRGRVTTQAALPSIVNHHSLVLSVFVLLIPGGVQSVHGLFFRALGNGHAVVGHAADGFVGAGDAFHGEGGLRALDCDDGAYEGHLLVAGEVVRAGHDERDDGAGGLRSGGVAGAGSGLGGGRRGEAEEHGERGFGVHLSGVIRL